MDGSWYCDSVNGFVAVVVCKEMGAKKKVVVVVAVYFLSPCFFISLSLSFFFSLPLFFDRSCFFLFLLF